MRQERRPRLGAVDDEMAAWGWRLLRTEWIRANLYAMFFQCEGR